MPEIAADLQTACSDLFFGAEIERLQPLGPDADLPRARTRAREANGRFAIGHSGNPKGRPRGIRQPRRRPLGLLLRQAKPGSLGPLIERKPYLCLPVLRLVLPPVHAADPGDLLRIDFSRMGDAAEIADAIGQVLQAVSRGKFRLARARVSCGVHASRCAKFAALCGTRRGWRGRLSRGGAAIRLSPLGICRFRGARHGVGCGHPR